MKAILSGIFAVSVTSFSHADDASHGKMPADMEKKGSYECQGGNACKGRGDCSGPHYSCAGNNSCKGKGFVMTQSKEACEGLKVKLRASSQEKAKSKNRKNQENKSS